MTNAILWRIEIISKIMRSTQKTIMMRTTNNHTSLPHMKATLSQTIPMMTATSTSRMTTDRSSGVVVVNHTGQTLIPLPDTILHSMVPILHNPHQRLSSDGRP